MKNMVYLVGAGPGDAGLLTLKAAKVMKKADVVLYDRLVGKEILKKLSRRVTKVNVGKKEGSAFEKQTRICRLIKKYYEKGLTIVRLQNGDPLLFGRGGEEIEFLRREGIEYQVIPGVTSAVGVASSVGLPLTHRRISSGLVVVPGHPAEGNKIDWKEIAEFKGTIVILMGAGSIQEICRKLMAYGKEPSTPACMIRNGTLPSQRIVTGKLSKLGILAREWKIKAPAITVIGQTVALAKFYRR